MTPFDDVICFFSRCLVLVPVVMGLGFSCRCGASTFGADSSMTQYISRAWQTDEGLPLNAVQTLAQTRDGYLWVGTARGLSRFDGTHFTTMPPGNTPDLQRAAVTAIYETRDGTLWVGTTAGLSYMHDGQLLAHKLVESGRGNYIKCMLETRDGAFWVGTQGGLFCRRDEHWTQYTRKDGLQDDVVRALCEGDDRLYIGSGSGLNVFKDGKITSQGISRNLENSSLQALLFDSRGNLWIGMMEGLACIQGKETKIYTKKRGLPDSKVTALHQDRHGDIWIGTSGGLFRFLDGKFVVERDHEGSFYDQINDIIEDAEGDVWLATRDGLHELRAKRFIAYTRQQGLTHNNVMTVLESGDGSIWVGAWGGGLIRLKDDKFTPFNRENMDASGLATDLVLSLLENPDGSILAGADYEGGTFRFDPASGKFARYWSQAESLTNRVVRQIYRDHEGNLWFACASGLVLDGANKKYLTQDDIRCVTEDAEGTLWVGTNRRLYRRENGEFVPVPLQGEAKGHAVLALYVDRQQNLWMALDNCGLGLYQSGQLTLFTPQQGLWSDQIFEILEDDRGWLWMSCSKGIFRVHKNNLLSQTSASSKAIVSIGYGKADGMEGVLCSGVSHPAAWRGHDGRLWFATSKGLAVTDPAADLAPNEIQPPVKIEQVLADKKPVAFSPGSPLRLQVGRGELEIHYAALSYQLPEKNQFRYRLSGVDTEWVDAGSRRVAYYNNLRPGSYLFQVTGCNNEGVWSETPVEFGVTLLPHVWQLAWFKVIAAFAGAGLISLTVRYLTRKKLQRKLEGLEAQNAIEKERTRIAQDMHDDLGARLTEILLLNELARKNKEQTEPLDTYLGKQVQVVRSAAESLDTIVWAVNPVNDSVDRLANYLCEQVERLFSVSPIRCRFDVPEQLPQHFVSSEVRHNVFLTVRESLNNVIKHSGASEVWFRIRSTPAALSIVIEDDGKGISDAADRFACGNGLQNMERRMKNLGGSFRLVSRPGKGTQIHLEVPLRPAADERNGKASQIAHNLGFS